MPRPSRNSDSEPTAGRFSPAAARYITRPRRVYSKHRRVLQRDAGPAAVRPDVATLVPMLRFGILAAMIVAGYLDAPGWVVFLGAAAILSEGWGMKLRKRLQRRHTPWSSKATTYFVAGMVANVVLSILAYGIGRLARTLMS